MAQQKLVSIWNPKGGQGKSMLALNLAAAATHMGLKALVIDQDQQGTVSSYFSAGNLPFVVLSKAPEKRPDADIVFIDHQASDWEVPTTQLLLIPVKPARDQYSTYIDAYARAQARGKQIITVVTDSQGHRASEVATTRRLKDEGALLIPSSGVFSRAAEDYYTIFDDRLNKAYKIRERRQDIQRILARILIEETPAIADTAQQETADA